MKNDLTEERKAWLDAIIEIKYKKGTPVTKLELAEALFEKFQLSHQEIMNNISTALYDDKNHEKLIELATPGKTGRWQLSNNFILNIKLY